ncbi:hypothetical protein SK3146_01275 [Paenibacillus konkukensis]|uniref:Uncharacterized protein n=1 Tax=Paenibacillus konkukensis TaxID=2020716 RepID=A0ABY4RJ03_9BACL|nr:hypothetical protein SK3146_01275 [Paenibacillus konkukensis]
MDADFVCHYYWPDDSAQDEMRDGGIAESRKKASASVKRKIFGWWGRKSGPRLRRVK